MSRRHSIRLLTALGAISWILVSGINPALADGKGSTEAAEGGGRSDADPEPGGSVGQCEGDPIDVFTGRFFVRETDLVVDGVFPIRFERRYESDSQYDSPLGNGWSHNWDMRVYETEGVQGKPNSAGIIFRNGCGRKDRYDNTNPDDSPSTYTATTHAKGRLPRLEELAGGGWQVTYPSGRRVMFDQSGLATRVLDAQGNGAELVYTPEGETPTRFPMTGLSPYSLTPDELLTTGYHYRIAKIREFLASGVYTDRELTLEYDGATGRLTAIQSHDGRRVEYEHTAAAATGGSDPDLESLPNGGEELYRGNLARVVLPTLVEQHYRYTDPHFSHRITWFRDGQGLLPRTNTYYPPGTGSEDGLAESQTYGDSVITITYDDTDPLAKKRSVVRQRKDSSGSALPNTRTDYTFNTDGNPTDVDRYANAADAEPQFKVARAWNPLDASPNLREVYDGTGTQLLYSHTAEYDGNQNLTKWEVTTAAGETIRREWTYSHDWIQQYVVESGVEGSGNEQLWQQIDVLFYREGDPDLIDPCTGSDTGTGRPVNIRCIRIRVDPTDPATTIGWGYRYDADGQLVRVIPPPPGLAGTPDDDLEIVYTYYLPGDATPGASPGMLKSIHLEADEGQGSNPLENGKWTILYDAASRISEVQDALDNPTQYQWDAASRLIQVSNAEGDVTTYTYGSRSTFDGAGTLLRRITRGDGTTDLERTRLDYDPRGNVADLLRWDGTTDVAFAHFAYDSDDNRDLFEDARFVASSGSAGLQYRYTWDGLGRLTDILDNATVPGPGGNLTQLQYDFADRIKRVIDARNATTDFAYDYMGRLTRAIQYGLPGEFSPPLETKLFYDPLGNVVEVQDPDHVGVADPSDPTQELATRYAWDGLSRLTAVEQPLGNTVQYFFDARSQLARIITARDRKLDFTYAAWGGLLQRDDYPTSASGTPDRTVSYGYDASGNLRSVADDTITVESTAAALPELVANRLYTFGYDDADRVASVTPHYIPGAPGITVASDHDHRGLRTDLDFTTGGHTYELDWSFDPQGRLDDLTTTLDAGTPRVVDYAWYPNDALEQIAYASSVVTDLTYHDHGPLNVVTVTGASELLSLAYTPDRVLGVDQIDETWNGAATPFTFDYGYDGLQRLTSATYPTIAGLTPAMPSGAAPFAYDDAGNREDVSTPPDDWASNENNQLTKSPASPPTPTTSTAT